MLSENSPFSGRSCLFTGHFVAIFLTFKVDITFSGSGFLGFTSLYSSFTVPHFLTNHRRKLWAMERSSAELVSRGWMIVDLYYRQGIGVTARQTARQMSVMDGNAITRQMMLSHGHLIHTHKQTNEIQFSSKADTIPSCHLC